MQFEVYSMSNQITRVTRSDNVVPSPIKGSSEADVVYSNVIPMHSSAAQNIPTDDMMNLRVNTLLVIHLIQDFI